MTVGIMARSEEGHIVCASDSAINIGQHRITKPDIKGQYLGADFVLFAGGLSNAQRVFRSEEYLIQDAIETVDWEEAEGDDLPEFLVATHDGLIYTIDTDLATVHHDEWGAIGHGGDAARMLLEALYKKRSASYVASTLKTIIHIVQKYDATVYGPVRAYTMEHCV